MINDEDLEKCLSSLKIEKHQIVPMNFLRQQQHHFEINQFRTKINIFPLEWFDSGDGKDFEYFVTCKEGEIKWR